MDGCKLKLLGPIYVEKDGEVVDGFVSRKAVALLGYLAVEARPLRRSFLAHLFWEAKTEARGRGNLSRVINNLTTLLPGHLLADYHIVQFNLALIDQVDIVQFKALIDQSNIPDLVRAILLYRGDFMAGINLPDCPEFDIWLAGERERWRRQAVQALRQIIDHYLQRGDYEVAVNFVAKLLDITPWHEEGHRLAMNLLARTGRRSEALAQYKTCRRILAEEFAVAPAAKTTELYDRVKAMVLEPIHNLPAQPTPFLGRAVELAQVTHHLSNPDCRLLTLVGPGGIGKTRLALQAGQRITQYQYVAFLHGLYFVALAPVQAADLLASTIADAIGLSLYGAAKPVERLLSHLQQKEMLLILDNFEHLLDGVELVRHILEQAPEIKILVTSRARLNLRWEWLIEVGGLDIEYNGAAPDPLAPIAQQRTPLKNPSALALFEQIARRLQPDFTISDQNRALVSQICRLVGGMPLGIELAAAQIRDYSCDQIAEGIEHNLDFLTTALLDLPPRHRSLRAVFDYSWRFLTAEEQQVFCRLSVFEGGFEQEAAEQIAEATGPILASLVSHSFLQRRSLGRYDMHERLRQYALESLQATPHAYERTKDHHCAYFAAFLQQRELQQGGRQKEGFAEITAEIDNIRAAWRLAVERERLAYIEKAILALFAFYELRGWFAEGVEVFRWEAVDLMSGRKSATSTDKKRVYAKLLFYQAWFSQRLGQYERARELLEQGLAILQQPGAETQTDVAFALQQLGLIHWLTGDYSTAEYYLQESLELSRTANDVYDLIHALTFLGLTTQALGNYRQARELHQECLSLCKQADERYGMAMALTCLGRTAYTAGDYVEAKLLLEQGLAVSKEMEHSFGQGFALTLLGAVTWQSGEAKKGKQLCLQALVIFTETGEQFGQTIALNALGRITWGMGAYAESRRYFLEALQTAYARQLAPQVLTALAGLALHVDREGQSQQALELTLYLISHPAAEYETKERAKDFLAERFSRLSLQTVAEIEKNIKDQDVQSIAHQVLNTNL